MRPGIFGGQRFAEVATALWLMGSPAARTPLRTATALWLKVMAPALTPVRTDPRNAEAHHHLSMLLVSWGGVVRKRGGDPHEIYERATEHARTAVELVDDSVRFLVTLATTYRMRASWERQQGLDPRPLLAEAEATHRLAIRSDPGNSMIWNNLGVVYRDRALYEVDQELDARSSLDQAVAGFLGAIRHAPEDALPYFNLGQQAVARAEEQERRGVDPCADLEDVLGFLERQPRQEHLSQQAEAIDRIRELFQAECHPSL